MKYESEEEDVAVAAAADVSTGGESVKQGQK